MIQYKDETDDITSNMLSGFFVGWLNPPSQETHLDILNNSTFKIMAFDESENRVIGFITAISDCVLSAYIPFLEVLPDYQKQGIGKELVKQMLLKLKNLYMVDVMCDPEMQSFYEQCGLSKASGMVIRNYKYQNGNKTQAGKA